MDTTSPTCQCGCGATVSNRFAPGHDAKLKSALLTATRTNQWWVRESAVNQLAELGWGHFVDVAVLDRVPVRSRHAGRFVRTRNLRTARYLCTDAAGTTHSSRACPQVHGECTDGDEGFACSVCVHTMETAELAWCGR